MDIGFYEWIQNRKKFLKANDIDYIFPECTIQKPQKPENKGKLSNACLRPLFDYLKKIGIKHPDFTTVEATKEKFGCDGAALYPKVSVINPELQATVSKEYLVYSASDIIAHSIEGYFTAKAHPELIRAYIEANIKTVMKTTEILLKDPENY